MAFYEILGGGSDDALSMTYSFHPHGSNFPPWPKDQWNPLDALTQRALNDHVIMPDDLVQNLPTCRVDIRPRTKALGDVIGDFSFPLVSFPPLVSAKFRTLIEEIAPGTCEFIDGPQEIHDLAHDRIITQHDYSYCNVTELRPTWDDTQTEVCLNTRRDGTQWWSKARGDVTLTEGLEDAIIWRDARTHHPLCSDIFREAIEAAGITNIWLSPLNTWASPAAHNGS